MCFAHEARTDAGVLRSVRGPFTIDAPTYVALLALGPALFAYYDSLPWLLALSALLLGMAWYLRRLFAKASARHEARGRDPRRAWIAEEGIFIDGLFGPGHWQWSAVASAHKGAEYVVLQFVSGEALVLACSGSEAERLLVFITQHIPNRVVANRWRTLALLAVLYLLCVAATVVFAR